MFDEESGTSEIPNESSGIVNKSGEAEKEKPYKETWISLEKLLRES